MRPAKLFAVLAAAFAIIEGIDRVRPFLGGYIGLPWHETYYLQGPTLVLLFCAAASLNFAILYYAGERIFHMQWHRTLSALHLGLFLLFGLCFLFVFAASIRAAVADVSGQSMSRILFPWIIGILSLLASLLIFSINLALSATQLIRTRLAKR